MRRHTDKKKTRRGLTARSGRLRRAREREEYEADLAEARAALAEMEVQEAVPWQQVKEELGL